MACKKAFACIILSLALLFSPAFQFVSSAADDGIDDSYGGNDADTIIPANVVYVNLNNQVSDNVYNQDISLHVDVGYDLSDGVVPYSVTTVNARLKILSVPAGATVSGTMVVFFTGTSKSQNTDKGYVYYYNIVPPSVPTVSLNDIYFTTDFVPTCQTTITGNGMLVYSGAGQSVSSQYGYIPVLSDTFHTDVVQQFSCPYTIKNTSTSARDCEIYVSADTTSGSLYMTKQNSLASLYSAVGIDYTNILNNIYSSIGNDPVSGVNYSVRGYLNRIMSYLVDSTGTLNIAYLTDYMRKAIGDYDSSDTNNLQGKLKIIYNSVGAYGSTNESSINGRLYHLIQRLDDLYDALKGTGGVASIIKEQTEKQIDIAENQLQTAEEQLETEKEQLETSKGIFGKITDFFDNFFSNLQDFIVHLIIPTQEEITAFFDEVNEWFSARLGFIWYPFDLMLDLVTTFSSGTANQNFTVPGLSMSILGIDYQIWASFEVDLDAFGIFQYVRLFTSFLMVSGIVKMAMSKWDEWIGGHNS